jgi:hypothetical protein
MIFLNNYVVLVERDRYIYVYDNISMDLPSWTFGVLKHFENVTQRFGSGV